MISRFSKVARDRIRNREGGYRRDHLRALAQRVEVADDAVRIMGSKTELLRTLFTENGRLSAAIGVPRSGPKWRRGWPRNFSTIDLILIGFLTGKIYGPTVGPNSY
jgi:hypothetical protein